MFGLLLRSELLQGSAVRTWNRVLNIANYFRYKFNSFIQPEMPRSRRRHHSRSRSRSRSHSHDRDREPKRRRVESPDNSHHRRSVSCEKDVAPNEDAPMELSPIEEQKNITSEKIEEELKENTSKEINTTIEENIQTEEDEPETDKVAQQDKDSTKEDENEDKIENKSETDNEDVEPISDKEAHEENNDKDKNEKESKSEDEPETDKVAQQDKDSTKEDDNEDKIENKSETDSEDVEPNSDKEVHEENNDKDKNEKESKPEKENKNDKDEQKTDEKFKDIIAKSITPKKITPKKVLSPMQIKKQEERLKLKHEREEQKRKEREEKEERKRKEKEEKEERKRKDREEKEEQKRKIEEQKRKEKEEKEELKRKEKEEKDEQKRKEREEKEEQKRKEKEEKELKRQQELDEKNKEKKKKEEQILKEKAAFANFFRKSASSAELKKPEPEPEQTFAFMPFEVKSDMRLAPTIRKSLSSEQKNYLVDKIADQVESVLYLEELKKGKQIGMSEKTWPVLDDSDDIVVLEDSDIGEKVEEEPKAKKMRAKLLKFHENKRPAYFGTWRKNSKHITPRKPLAVDKKFFDYEVDSDDDWEEEEPGESLHGSDDEEKENDEKDDYEVDNEFFVPHGYLSDEEIEAEENTEVSPETQKEKLKILQEEFDEEMKSKTQKIKPRLIGCIWENKLIPKVQDAIHKFLEDRMMIVTGTIQIQKREILNTTIEINTPKPRKPLSEDLIPEFLKFIHGSTRKQGFIVNEFQNYIISKNLDVTPSKGNLLNRLKQFAKWKKCPDEGEMLNKFCWYVEEDVRSQYEVNLTLPNTRSSFGKEENDIKKSVNV